MLVRLLCVAVLSLAAFAQEPKAESKMREPDPQWLAVIERLRIHPGPGDVIHAGVDANLRDVYVLNDADRAQLKKLCDEYQAQLLERAAKWEEELKKLRAEHEAKMIALLPENKRAQTEKILEYSHRNWITEHDRDAKFKRDFLERMKAHPKAADPETAREQKMEHQLWIKEQREKARKQDEEAIKTIRTMLTPEESERLDQFDKNRAVPAVIRKEDKK